MEISLYFLVKGIGLWHLNKHFAIIFLEFYCSVKFLLKMVFSKRFLQKLS